MLFLLAVSTALQPVASKSKAPAEAQRAIDLAVADRSRPASERSRDLARKPAGTLRFAGVRPGMVVGEFYPGGGYFTRLLSQVVGRRGHVFGIQNAGWKEGLRAGQAMLAERSWPNLSMVALPFGSVAFPRPLDLVWVSQNYHDLKIAEYGRVDTADFNRAVFRALKPGGVYLVLDHQAPPGTGEKEIARLHRIEKAQVIREVTAAGFKLEAEGSFLRRSDDDLTLPITDERIQGRTDQFALRFVKPR